ncbi:EAL domain-containing protein [Aquipuribacter hungaricus]|uniref:EAL domain-containing protein n=1 Tax=Aquipuribacter hungaricus TaxID=545624 RepID=A0ABV7WC66_9MICO
MVAADHASRGAADPASWRTPVQVLADLAEPAVVVLASDPLQRVERLFDDDPGLRHVVLEAGDAFHLVDRLHLDHLRRERPWPGLRLHRRTLLSQVELPTSVVLPSTTPVDQAAATVLGRDATASLEAVVCVDDHGRPGVVPVRRLFESLSRTFARQSVLDPLTGLPNRLHLMNLLDRRAPSTPAALLYVDLDRFKDVNDSYGHGAGDAVLVEFAARMRRCCRSEDVVLRLGGDEFAVLVPTDVGDGALLALAGRVVAAAAAPFTVPLRGPDGAQTGEATVHVGASVGVTHRAAGRGEDALAAMLAEADAAMYLAKDQGRGTVRTFEEARRVAEAATDDRPSRHTIERRLREALDGSTSSRLHLVYQPIVDLTTGAVVELEALARWDDGVLGTVPPDRFVPVAEAGGLILELGRWALRAACVQAATWAAVGRVAPSVSVNVSPLQLVDPGFETDVIDALTAAGLPADRLVLEITEAAGVDDLPRTAAVLHSLRGRGIRVALDDFGAGRSSLTLLRELPLDTVKVDRSLVSASSGTVADALVLRLLVEVCHGLGLRVCMEGVEEEVEAVRLTGLGADTGQGWCFGRPAAGVGADATTGTLRALRPRPPHPEERGSDEFVVAVDREGRVVYVSTRAFDVLGFLPSDVVGRPFGDLVDEADRPVVTVAGRCVMGPAHAGGTVRMPHVDGARRWVSVRPAGGPERAPGMDAALLLRCRDVTTVVEAQHRLREAEETFRLVFDGAPTGMALSGLDGTIQRVNAAFATMLGREAHTLVGLRVEEITWPEDRAVDEVHLGQHREGKSPEAPVRKRYVGHDGRPVHVEVQVSLVASADGEPAAVVAHVHPAPSA